MPAPNTDKSTGERRHCEDSIHEKPTRPLLSGTRNGVISGGENPHLRALLSVHWFLRIAEKAPLTSCSQSPLRKREM